MTRVTSDTHFWRVGHMIVPHGRVNTVYGDKANARLILGNRRGDTSAVPINAHYMDDILNYCLAHLRDQYCRETWDEDWNPLGEGDDDDDDTEKEDDADDAAK